MSWQERVGRGTTEGWAGHAELSEAPAGDESGPQIDRTVDLGPQVLRRLDEAKQRLAALEDRARGLALDAQLDRAGAGARLEVVETDLVAARTEVSRLQQAYSQAIARDAHARAQREVADLQDALMRYEGFANARITAMADLTRHTREATEAARRFLASTSLLQDGVDPAHQLARGLILGRDLEATPRAVEAETNNVLAHMRRLVGMTVAAKLGREITDD